MHPPDHAFYYKLLAPKAVGIGFAADVFNGGEKDNMAFLAPLGAYSGQLWRFVPTGGGAFRLSTLFRGPDLLAGVCDGGPNDGLVRLSSEGDDWSVEPLPDASPFAGAFFARLSPGRRGPEQCLDVSAGEEAFMPLVAPRSEATGQWWLLARTTLKVE